MRYHALKEAGIAIGSGVVEAANKTLVAQRMKRSGMRWRIVGGQAVLTFRALRRELIRTPVEGRTSNPIASRAGTRLHSAFVLVSSFSDST